MYPFNHKRGQRIQSDVPAVFMDRGFISHFQVPASEAVAASTTGIIAAITLGAVVQEITNANSPAWPRALQVVGNVAGIAGNIVIHGTNFRDAAISETFALNGSTPVLGTKAFKRVTRVVLPVESHNPQPQMETITVTNGATLGAGTLVFRATGTLLGGNVDVNVPVLELDSASVVAGKIRTVLEATTEITDHFEILGTDADIVLAALVPAANDGTLAMSLQAANGTGVTVGASQNTLAGVGYDLISIGWLNVLGLPYLLPHNTVLAAYLNNAREAVAPTVTTHLTAIESNTIKLNSALAGQIVDAYLIV